MSGESEIRFPGESSEYRRERDRLLEAEVALRRTIEHVAAQRRALPPGGSVPENYRFEEAGDGSEVSFFGAIRAREGHARHLQLHVPAVVRRYSAWAAER